MTRIIATFMVDEVIDENDTETTTEDMDDMLKEIGDSNDMTLISWGTI
jgi:hypothetical protein